MENAKDVFEKAIEVLQPTNTTATPEEKLKAIDDLRELFSILYE